MNKEAIGCIICEETRCNVEFKVKGEDKTNGYIIAEGILQDGADDSMTKNRNGRAYPTEELRRAIMAPRMRELVETGNLKGECGHPLDQSIQRQSKIDGRNEQVWYKKIWMDEGSNLVRSVFTGTSNDLGKAFNEDLRRGQLPSFSLRAIGQLIREANRAVVSHLNIITYDRVYYPSHSCAYTTKIIATESGGSAEIPIPDQNISINPRQIKRLTEAGNSLYADPIVVPLTQAEVANYLVHESENIQTAISTFDVLYESIELNPSLNTVTMKTRMGDTFHICLEEAVKREVLDGIAKFF